MYAWHGGTLVEIVPATSQLLNVMVQIISAL